MNKIKRTGRRPGSFVWRILSGKVFCLIRGVIFITAGANPRPTLNYRRGGDYPPVFNGTGFIPHPSKPSVLPPSPLGRLNRLPPSASHTSSFRQGSLPLWEGFFAADSCFYTINILCFDKAKKRLFMRKTAMTCEICERIFIHFLHILL